MLVPIRPTETYEGIRFGISNLKDALVHAAGRVIQVTEEAANQAVEFAGETLATFRQALIGIFSIFLDRQSTSQNILEA
ncbi:MAG: hypothetical protein PHS44_00770 [Candidatus Dojkabacteria bacterium]|nr:hypothetical protein [Candidatus Dojkabacteria bacterium]